MRFEWDFEKARRNLAKHGITFELAQRVWDDPLHVVIPDRIEDGEQRWHAIGAVSAVVIVVVVHTYPDENDANHVRIIGARKATSHERRRYEEEV
ncbi:BrnT family toxin [Taklimakanibacter lacteus]|uniref:BrnT family toxin n=1 Tax=Taklimakanibacter lacteus TaxID=2268456 RepID=UPI000E66C49F